MSGATPERTAGTQRRGVRAPGADALSCVAIFAFALIVEAGVSLLAAPSAPPGWPSLAVFFDGHKYLEIARSFPLPYAAESRQLLGHAPGYPAAIALLHALGGGLLDWGSAALLMAWLASALAAAAFGLLARRLGTPPLWPGLLFAAANPRWLGVGATAHAEPLAMLFSILCLRAWLGGSLGRAVLWLGLAALTRFPAILLGLPLAWAALRRQPDLRSVALLACPPGALLLLELYLRLRVPGFQGIWAAHAFWWEPQWTLPFAGLFRHAEVLRVGWGLRELTWASALFYLLAAVAGLRAGGVLRLLGLWATPSLLLAAAAGDAVGTAAFTRLALLAWPPSLLVVWLLGLKRLPRAWIALGGGLLLACGAGLAVQQIRLASYGQRLEQPYLNEKIRRLEEDEPQWLDFEAIRRQGGRRRRPTRSEAKPSEGWSPSASE